MNVDCFSVAVENSVEYEFVIVMFKKILKDLEHIGVRGTYVIKNEPTFEDVLYGKDNYFLDFIASNEDEYCLYILKVNGKLMFNCHEPNENKNRIFGMIVQYYNNLRYTFGLSFEEIGMVTDMVKSKL